PIFEAIDRIAVHCESHWSPRSRTMRTARSSTSGENLLGRPIDSILPQTGVSGKPGTVQRVPSRARIRLRQLLRLSRSPKAVSVQSADRLPTVLGADLLALADRAGAVDDRNLDDVLSETCGLGSDLRAKLEPLALEIHPFDERT